MEIAFKIFLSSSLLWMIFSWLSRHGDELKLPTLAYKICLIVGAASVVTTICSMLVMIWLI